MWNNRIIAYKRKFSVSKNFTIGHFLEVLDKEDFLPFILYPTTVSLARCRLKSHYILYPFAIGRLNRLDAGLILSEYVVEWDKENSQLTLKPSMNILSAIFLFFPLSWLVLVPALATSFTQFIFVLLFCLIASGFELVIYYRDKKRYERIGDLAKNL